MNQSAATTDLTQATEQLASENAVPPVPEPKPLGHLKPELLAQATPAAPANTHDAMNKITHGEMTEKRIALPPAKEMLLQQQLASTIKDYAQVNKPAEEAVAVLQANWQAMETALNPHGELANQAAQTLTDALNKQLSDEGCHVPTARQAQSVFSIFTKRQSEAKTSLQLLQDANFVEQAIALSQQSTPPDAPHWYNDEKKAEIIAELGDNLPHVLANALGQHMQHKALAETFRLNGPLEAPLISAMHTANPELPIDTIREFSKSWLHERFHRAQKVAEVTKPSTGELACKAMCHAEKKVAEKYGVPLPQKAVNDDVYAQKNHHHNIANLPATSQISAPAQHEGIITQPSLNNAPSV